MGHLINPTRFRLGNSLFWANNWPALNKNEYFQYYEIYQEITQYFKNLFYNFRKYRVKRQRKRRKYVLRKLRYPKIYYSHVNINFFGLNLENIMVDVNAHDFFLDSYLKEALSISSIEQTDAPNLAKFLKRLNTYIGFEFFFKHKNVIQKISKEQYAALLKICRDKILIFEQIVINKLQIFIDIYIEFIRKSLFSTFNDQKSILNPIQAIFHNEKRALNHLSFSQRIRLIQKYWTRKYAHTLPENKSLLTFQNYFTSEFYYITTPRKLQNNEITKKERTALALKSYLDHIKNYHKKCEFRNLAISSLNSRLQEKVEGAIRKTNTIITKPISFVKTNENSEFRSFPHEIPSRSHISKYDKDLQNYSSDESSDSDIEFNNESRRTTIPSFIIEFQKIIPKLKSLSLYLYMDVPERWPFNFTLVLNKDLNSLTIDEQLIKFTSSSFINQLIQFVYFVDKHFDNQYKFLVHAITFIKEVNKYNRLQYKYIKNVIKRSANYWLKYDLDPFFQHYMKLRHIKNLHLNINLGIAPEEDMTHEIIDAKFIALYIKRLFKRNKFKIPDLERTVFKSLSRLPYLEGFLVIFAGRFTRRESKIRHLSKSGILHLGTMSKLIDYHTIGFAGKFGYCGVKVFLQYKPKWREIGVSPDFEALPEIKSLPIIKDFDTPSNVITNKIQITQGSKRYTRLVQNLFSKNQIPYYYHGKDTEPQ